MSFKADIHIHSRFSRATAKNLDIENLYIAALLKGITVVCTGDITHPEWFSEVCEKLVPAEEGLFELKNELALVCNERAPKSCRNGKVRFMLGSEISSIYKKNGKTRKIHNLVFLPDIKSVKKFNARLDKIGNIKSDGRPILGLDARNLLEILLETSDQGFCIPAHIWTPWFSVFGSKSGFDTLEECFEDLTEHIFALETGLSSDPEMNWRISGLDGLTLVSNSDAHSPMKLGREANVFETELSYTAIKHALKTGDPEKFLGTLEFYPEEGKYHMDGHRKCKVCFTPQETLKAKGICPACGKPLTIGVLYRVEELADRLKGQKPERTHPFSSIVPLTDILSEIIKVGPNSKKVKALYDKTLNALGSELSILNDIPLKSIDKADIPLLTEAIHRMRSKQIHLVPGYDGEFGKIKIFSDEERETFSEQKKIFSLPASRQTASEQKKKYKFQDSSLELKSPQKEYGSALEDKEKNAADSQEIKLNTRQKQAVEYPGGPMIIVAGPGTGKTFTLTQRIAWLINIKNVPPKNILALTFTNKAATEMKHRLKKILTGKKGMPRIHTFHSLCFKIIQDNSDKKDFGIVDEEHRKSIISDAIKQVKLDGVDVKIKPGTVLDHIVQAKQNLSEPDDFTNMACETAIYKKYQEILGILNSYDYEDLIFNIVKRLETDEEFRSKYRESFKYIFVDEYQDLNHGQYRIIKALCPENKDICVIGDPEQSIYGFRGADPGYFKSFVKDYPGAGIIRLTENYRSTETILQASAQVIKTRTVSGTKHRVYSGIHGIKTITTIQTLSGEAEAVAVGKTIEQLIGGTGFHTFDFGTLDNVDTSVERSFSDFAILYRTNAQGKVFSQVFNKAGIPCQLVGRDNIFNNTAVSQIISLLKITNGAGSFRDIQKIIELPEFNTLKRPVLSKLKSLAYTKQLNLLDLVSTPRWFPLADIEKKDQRNFNDFMNHMSEIAEQSEGLNVEQKISFLIDKSHLKTDDKTMQTFEHLISLSKEFGSDITSFFKTIALESDTDTYDYNAEKVVLMSMHAAKGLEFPVVFIAGCEDDYMPFRKSPDAAPDLNEERRLLYVAMTRARELLYLTYAKKRVIYGKRVAREISPFVKDIERRLLKGKSSCFEHKKEKQTQIQLF